jgi:hypothetical protein
MTERDEQAAVKRKMAQRLHDLRVKAGRQARPLKTFHPSVLTESADPWQVQEVEQVTPGEVNPGYATARVSNLDGAGAEVHKIEHMFRVKYSPEVPVPVWAHQEKVHPMDLEMIERVRAQGAWRATMEASGLGGQLEYRRELATLTHQQLGESMAKRLAAGEISLPDIACEIAYHSVQSTSLTAQLRAWGITGIRGLRLDGEFDKELVPAMISTFRSAEVIADRIISRTARGYNKPETSIALARKLAWMRANEIKKDSEGQGDPGDMAQSVEEAMQDMEDMAEQAGEVRESGNPYDIPEEDFEDRWCPMETRQPTLTTPSRHRRAKRKRVGYSGMVPRAPSRWLLDRRIMERTLRKDGMSLLVDCSGSMSWDPADLERVLELAPPSTIGLYSGNGERGVLEVVADNGKRLSQPEMLRALRERVHEGSNDVDGPALRWLADQLKPRLWLSDGGVTGRGEASAVVLRTECARLCIAHEIIRMDQGPFKEWLQV